MAENLNTLYYSLGLDDREMQEGLKKAIQNLASLDNEFNKINDNISKTFGKKIQTSPIHNEIKGLKGELQDLEKQWSALSVAERRGAQGTELRAKYEALRKDAGNLNNSLGKLYTESQKAAAGQKGLATQLGMVSKEFSLANRAASNFKTILTGAFSIFAAKAIIQNLAQVRGEFELQQVSLRAILRDAEAADKIFGQIKAFSVVSPFEFKDLVGYAKQLSAFQVPVNELFDTTKRLADVSAGLGVGMDRIILAYGQVRAASVLRGCLGFDTEIITLEGIRKVQDIKVGDKLPTDSSTLNNVIELIRGREQMYLIKQEGTNYRVNENHILTLSQNGKVVDVCLKNIKDNYSEYLGVKFINGEYATYPIEIIKDKIDDYYGFVLDGNKRFLLGDNTLTHNTELRQFTEAGIPLVDELAKKFSELEGRVVSAGDVFEKISNRMVSFEMVKDIFADLTNEGGMFYMMQEKQAESLKGKIANLADAYSIMLNDIGEANDGILKGGVEGISSLMQNWENVWSILKTIIAGYGAYKAAIIALIAIEKVHAGINMSGNLALTAKNLGIVISNLGRFQAALRATGLSAKAFHAAIGGIVGVLTVVGFAIYEVIQNSNKLSNELSKISNTEFSSFKQMSDSLENLSDKLKNTVQGSQEHRDLIKQINNVYGEYLPFVLNESTALDAVANSTNDVIEAMKKRKMMMAQEKGEQAIEQEYGEDLASTRKNTVDFLTKINVAKADAINIVRMLEERLKQTGGEASVEDLYNEVKKYLDKDIFKDSAYSVDDFWLRVKYLAETIQDITKAEKELSDQNSITFGTSFSTQQARLEFEKLEASYSKMRDELKKKPLDKEAFEEELAKINKQEQIAKINFKVQFDGLSLEKAQEQIKALEEISAKWKEIVKETIGKNKAGFTFKVSEGEDQFDYLDRLDKEYKKLTTQQELIDENLVTSPETIEATKTQLDLLNKIGKALNYNFKVDAKEENPRIQLLNKELDLIKKAKDDYDKLAKWQSQMAANQNIQTIYGIDFNEKDVETRAKDIISKISAISKKEGEKTQFSFDKWFGGDKTDKIIDNLKKTFDAISKEVDSYKGKYDLYEQLFGITGNKEMSISLAFNGDMEALGGGIVDSIKDGIMKAASDTKLTLDQILKLDFTKSASELGIAEELKKVLEKEVGKIKEIDTKNILDFSKLVADYADVQTKINTIIANGAKEQEDIEKNRAISGNKLADEAIAASKKKTRQQVAALESESFKLTTFYQQLFGDISSYGNWSLDFLIKKTKKIIDQLQTDQSKAQLKEVGKVDIEIDNQKLQLTESDIAKLIKQFGELNKAASERNPFKRLSEGIDEYRAASVKADKAAKDLASATNKADEEAAQLALDSANFEKDNALKKSFAEAAEIAGELSNSIGGISDILGTLGVDMEGAGGAILGGFQQTLSSLSSIDITKPFSIITGAIGAVGGLFKSIFGSKDAKLDKQIKASEKEVRRLQNAYKDLDREIDKSIGTDKYKHTSEQIGNLEAQQVELSRQAQAERDKKKTDGDKVADLERQYVELGQQIQDVLDNIRDEVVGGTANDIANELGNAFFDAFAAGEDYAEAWGLKVKDIVGKIVKQMLIDKLLSKKIEAEIDKYSAKWMDEKGNIDTNKVISSSEDFYNGLMNIGSGFQSAMEALTKDPYFMKLLGPTEEAGKGLSEGIKGVTEDTAQLLASYLNAIRGSVLLQELYMKNIDTNVAGIYQAMGGSPSITTTTTIPPEIIAAISEPFRINNDFLRSIDLNIGNMHSIAANSLAQLVMIQANTLNTANATIKILEKLDSVIGVWPKGGYAVKSLI